MARPREEFGLVPVAYPTTRRMAAPPRERADDLRAASADPDVKAVVASIGGDDQIAVPPEPSVHHRAPP
ncbi:LD-carboxypeptidase [Streptomyces sp. NPDC058417]|uniref:LD-carboxypeptidase n=1 Tax=unclassified Streptomyces TaxID=2593676 RepID=UPI003667EB15